MRADWPDDGEQPPDDHPDRRDDRDDTSDQRAPTGNPRAETRTRQEAYFDLRVAHAREECVAPPVETDKRLAEEWQGKSSESRRMWSEHQHKWPPENLPKVDRTKDPEGSWRGDRTGYLDVANNQKVESEYKQIVERERDKITPAMRAIESLDPDRQLVGLKNCRKGLNRIKEKVSNDMTETGRSASEAVSLVPDALRYTLQYDESNYTHGVLVDVARVREYGFKLETFRNYWSNDQYKGINSQWIDPDTAQRFELQFHTHISYEAKNITHAAYEKLRVGQPDPVEHQELEDFQKKVATDVPVPPDAVDIPDYP